MSTAGILLAAGGGSRFEGAEHKLLAAFRGRPLVCWALSAAADAGFDEMAVVVGSVDLGVLVPAGVGVIENSDWASGQASSLQTAVSWAGARDHAAIVIGLGDQPLVPSSAWTAVGVDAQPDRGGDIRRQATSARSPCTRGLGVVTCIRRRRGPRYSWANDPISCEK